MRVTDLKPAAPVRIHLLLAATLWTVVGVVLAVVGARWALESRPGIATLLIVVAVAVGVLKAVLVLAKVAGRIAARIRERGDGRCLGGFLSPRSWLLVAVMSVGGRLLRSCGLPHTVVGPLYLAVGVALATASGRLWSAFQAERPARAA